MYDSIIALQTRLHDLRNKQKATGNDTRYAALDCQIRNLEKAINILILVNNNPESFKEWANSEINNQIATANTDNENNGPSMLLREQAE